MRKMSTLRRLFAVATVALVSATAVGAAAGSAAAAPEPAIVHGTPKVPVTVDGVRYEPAGIHRFDGRQLYFVIDVSKPKELIAFTKESDFKAAVAAKKAELDKGNSAKSAGQYTTYYSEDEWRGDWLRVDSGWGINDLRAVKRGCGLFGCAGDWNDVISSLYVNGYQFLYADVQYGGSYVWAYGTGGINMSWYGFDNVGSSLNVWW